MRKPRGPREEDKSDEVMEELDAQIAMYDAIRLARPGMTQAKLDAEKARNSAKFDRRMAKARAKWERMTVLEQKAWADEYLRQDRKRRGPESKPPKAAELPLLYAIIAVAERDRAKAAKAREGAKAAEVDPYATHRKATGEEPRTPRATSPSPAPEAPPADTEPPRPEKPRKRRRGPAVGPIGSQAGGVWYPPIYDEDDFE